MKTKHNRTSFSIIAVLKPDYEKWDGVPRINIYLLRFMFILMLIFLGKDSWPHILTYDGYWNPTEAMSWSVWGAYSVLAVLGIFHPLKMLPIVMLEIMYKVIWLIIVAYPLWKSNQLMGSEAEGMTNGFLWVFLPILAMPWRYFFRKYVLLIKTEKRFQI